MFKQFIFSSIIGAGLIFAGPTMAHNGHGHHHDMQVIHPIVQPTHHPAKRCVSGKKVDQIQAQQKRSIKKGIRKGKLVAWEIQRVRTQQRTIRQTEKRLRNSGKCLTKKEAKKLIKQLERAGNKIRNLKRNYVRWGHNQRRHNRMH